ncbi:hypothetical protein LTR09_007361 [Extremus antarcticus]|uniref:Threonylcarbamoyl-AMP synthase n=1 Tax=Extremus antarcticus TaxID=702011 RepID=A0AAJ0DCQ6_9PEZI|nr:hypothetical protein LTR09_007361 [Extremus antarcticus]
MNESKMQTAILPVDVQNIGTVRAIPCKDDLLDSLCLEFDADNPDVANILLAADQLKHSDVPVAFPTETVYGLGADATRSAAVKGIYKAKQRPADNPLIVHFASLKQLRALLRPDYVPQGAMQKTSGVAQSNGAHSNEDEDPIPSIYHPLISRFWPGPLTIILPNPLNSPLAPEVTAGLNTFGARMPRHLLALALIQRAGVPVAAPSANASTKPSPTAAEHVAYDLDGRIETIIDGGPCDVGVESTVVDGMSTPPLVLRPGGISIEQLRACPGWEDTRIGYKNSSEEGSKPKAPGMKYRHYSPKAKVVLYEAGTQPPSGQTLGTTYAMYALHPPGEDTSSSRRVGVIATKRWVMDYSSGAPTLSDQPTTAQTNGAHPDHGALGFAGMLETLHNAPTPKGVLKSHQLHSGDSATRLLEMTLGPSTVSIARGIFAALRELDREGVDVIFVEGIDENEGETAAAVMNRLRKAAEIKIAS